MNLMESRAILHRWPSLDYLLRIWLKRLCAGGYHGAKVACMVNGKPLVLFLLENTSTHLETLADSLAEPLALCRMIPVGKTI